MKKKFINGFLLVAAFVALATSFVACDDTTEDKIANLHEQMMEQNLSMKDLLDKQINVLKDELAALEARHKEAVRNLKNQLAEKDDQLAEKDDQLAEKDNQLAEKDNQLAEKDNQLAEKDEQIGNMNDQIGNMNGQIGDLNDSIADINGQIAGTKGQIATLEETIETLKEQVTALENREYKCVCDADNDGVCDHENQECDLTQIVADIAEANKLIAEVKQIAEQALALAQDNAKLIEANKAAIEKNSTDIANNAELIKQHDVAIAAQGGLIADLQKSVDNLNGMMYCWSDSLKIAYDKAFEAYGEVAALKDSTFKALAAHEAAFKVLDGKVAGLATKVDELDGKVGNLQEQLGVLNGQVGDLNNQLGNLDNKVNVLDAQIAADVKRLETLAMDNLKLANAYADSVTNIVMQAVLDSEANLKEALNDSVATLNEKLAAIEAAYKSADDLLREDLNNLTARVETFESQLSELNTKVGNLTGAFNQLITSVLVQGVTSPVFGYAALPVNLRSNILAAYYGMTDQGTEFPTARPGFYVDQDALKLTSADVKMLGAKTWKKKAGETIVGDEGNAGTLYLTVNPNTVDFTGVQFQLVNSIEEECGVKLSSIAPSDHKLTFGVSRAGNNNGFYEAKATLAVNDINKVKVDLDLEALKDVVVDVKNFRDGFNITNVLTTVVEQLDGVLDANAVKATWTDELGETRSTYSHYAVAATAVKPLSYAFAKDINIQQVPGLDRAENFIDKMADKAYNSLESIIPDFGNMSFTLPTINKITIPELDPNDCVVKFKVDINTTVTITDTIEFVDTLHLEHKIDTLQGSTGEVPLTITVPEKYHTVDVEYVDSITGETIRHTEVIHIPSYDFDVTVPSTDFEVDGPTVKFDYPLYLKKEINLNIPVEYAYEGEQNIYDVVNKLYGNIVGSIEGVNTTIEDLSKFVDDVNAVLDDLNKLKDVTNKVEGVKDEVVAKISKFLDKFNAKFCTLINNANAVLQPVLLAKTNDGFCKLSKAKKMPTVVSNGLFTLMPTSHSAEILAPAAKKLVGVTNVYSLNYKANAQAGDAACLNALQAANAQENIGDVVAGDETKLDIMLQRGFVYEIAYTAVDFSGKVIAQKYYVRVK